MVYFIEFVISALVDYKQDVSVEEEKQGNRTVFLVRVNPADIGKVIGRQGQTINAIRNVLSIADGYDPRRVNLKVVEEG